MPRGVNGARERATPRVRARCGRWGVWSGCRGEERRNGWRGVRASEPEGEAQSDSQAGRPASKEGRQAGRQAGNQAGRQPGKQASRQPVHQPRPLDPLGLPT